MMNIENAKLIDKCLTKVISDLEFELKGKLSTSEYYKNSLMEDSNETNPSDKYSLEDIDNIKSIIVDCDNKSKEISEEIERVCKARKEFRTEFELTDN